MNVADSSVAVVELVAAVKRAIVLGGISSTACDRALRVVSIQLTLNAMATRTAGGGIDLRIPVLGARLRIGGSVTRHDTHTLDITLVPPEPRFEVRGAEVETVLLEAIRTIRTVIALAADGDDPFVLDTSTVELSFAITATGSISLGFDGELENELTHTLRLSLARPN